MKKRLFIVVFATCLCTNIFGQELFNHLSIGATAGLKGFGIELATPVTSYMQVRAGYTIMPKFKYNTTLSISDVYSAGNITYSGPKEFDVQGKLNMHDFKVLLDIFPSKYSIFHFTVGAYIGNSAIVDLYNKDNGALMDITTYNNAVRTAYPDKLIGLKLGDYLLEPDSKGNIAAQIKVQGLKPYVGIGLGRAVPNKSISFKAELGVMFWDTPKVYCNDHELTSEDVSGDSGKVLKTLSKITIYPMLNFGLYFKTF